MAWYNNIFGGNKKPKENLKEVIQVQIQVDYLLIL